MRNRALSRNALAALPWLGAALLWVFLVEPMRAERENRLVEQSQIRRDRLKADRTAREAGILRARVQTALGSSCRASTDPAAIRQRMVAATAGLDLAPFSLSVTGGPEGGAAIDTEGPRGSVEELLRRLGNTRQGGFLRSVALRSKGTFWGATATTGVIGALPRTLAAAAAECAGAKDPQQDPTPTPSATAPLPIAQPRRSPTSSRLEIPPPVFVPAPEEAAPFALVAFLRSSGKSRVSVRVGSEVRVISVGDQVEGWTCVSIDRDEGAVFTSATKPRLVLKGGAGSRH